MEFNGIIEVRCDAPLPKFVSKAYGEIAETRRSIRMTGGTKEQ
jgi:hypothetical protein